MLLIVVADFAVLRCYFTMNQLFFLTQRHSPVVSICMSHVAAAQCSGPARVETLNLLSCGSNLVNNDRVSLEAIKHDLMSAQWPGGGITVCVMLTAGVSRSTAMRCTPWPRICTTVLVVMIGCV